MKLFSNQDKFDSLFSTEDFRGYYQTASIISTETLSDYLYKIKDIFSITFNRLSNSINDQVVIDTTSTKFETIYRIKRIKFIDLKDHITSKPENFRGKYIDYSVDLINVSKIMIENTELTLNNLKIAISSFINEYSENKVSMFYGVTYFKETEKIIEKNRKEINQYFPDKTGTTKAYIGDVLKTTNDIESLYKNIEILDTILNISKIDYISKLTNECIAIIDVLIEQNTKSNILSKNNNIKKELISSIYISAKEVEFLNYVYANAIIFYSSFKNLTQDINKIIDITESN